MPEENHCSIRSDGDLDNRPDFIKKKPDVAANKSQALSQAWNLYEKKFTGNKNPKTVLIANKLVGPNQPPLVIAEIGLNHNGDIGICKKLIDVAIEAGCDAVKFQKRTIDLVYTKEKLDEPREGPFGKTYGDEKRALEFGKEEYKEIDKYCKEKGIIWFASVWDLESVDFLESFNVPCYKIPSPLLKNKKLLMKVKEKEKPMMISTGMSSMEEIKEAVGLLGEDNLIIMHCTSAYPAQENQLDLNVIKTLKETFLCPIGYSGHETGVYPTIIAAALGSCILERHITLNRAMYGSDHSASLEKRGIEIIGSIAKKTPTFLGSYEKKVYDIKPSLTGIM